MKIHQLFINILSVTFLEEGFFFVHWMIMVSLIELNFWLSFIGPNPKNIIFLLSILGYFPLCFKSFRLYKLPKILSAILYQVPFILLIESAAPFIRASSITRTTILGIPILMIPFILTWEIYKSYEALQSNEGISAYKYNNSYVDVLFLFSVLYNMIFRYLAITINIVHINWGFSFILYIVHLHIKCWKWVVTNEILSKRVLQPITSVHESNSSKDSKSVVESSEASKNENYLNNSVFENNSFHKAEIPAKFPIASNENITSNSTNTAKDIQEQFSKYSITEICFLCLSGFASSLSMGLLFWIIVWIFVTPTLLPHLSYRDIPPYMTGLVVLSAYTVGLLLCIICNPENVCMFLLHQTNMSKKKVIGILICGFGLLSVLQIAAVYLFLYYKDLAAFIGTLIFCVTIPYIFSVNTNALIWLCAEANSDHNESVVLRIFPGVITIVIIGTFRLSFTTAIEFLESGIFNEIFHYIIFILTFVICLSLSSFLVLFVILKCSLDETSKNESKIYYDLTLSFEKAKKVLMNHKKLTILGIFAVLILFITFWIKPFFINPAYHCISHHVGTLANVTNALSMYNITQIPGLSVMTWGINFGYDSFGKDNLRCIAQVIDESKADIIALQQTGTFSMFWGVRSILQYLARFTNSSFYRAVNPRISTLGVGIITKMEVVDFKGYILPDTKPVSGYYHVMMQLDCLYKGQKIQIINTYLASKYNEYYKEISFLSEAVSEQVAFVLKKLNITNLNFPTIVLGLFNLPENDPEFDALYNAGFSNTWNKNVEFNSVLQMQQNSSHIFFKGLELKINRIYLEAQTITGHIPIFAIFEFSKILQKKV